MSQMAGVTHGEGFTFAVCYLSLLEWVVCSFEKSQPDEMLMKFEAEMATQPWYRVLSGSPRTPACSVFPIAYYETWSSKSRVLLVTYGIAEHIMWHSFDTLLKTTQDLHSPSHSGFEQLLKCTCLLVKRKCQEAPAWFPLGLSCSYGNRLL